MTTLEVLTVFCCFHKAIRDELNPEELEQPLRAVIGRMKAGQAESIAELQKVLLSECGIQWDGTGKAFSFVVQEAKRQAEINKTKRLINGKIAELQAARKRLEFPNIAGVEAVEKAIETVKGTEP